MLPKIKLESLENIFYEIKGVNDQNVNMSFIDFQYSSQPMTSLGNTYPTMVSPTVATKSIKLHSLDVNVNTYVNLTDQRNSQYLYYTIKNEINKEYFKKSAELGEKNRINSPVNIFDINVQEMKLKNANEGLNVSRQIISKFVSSGNYIATDGRIGPSQWFVSNPNTYKYILSNLETSELVYKDNNIMMSNGHMPYIISDSIDDDIILTGRKNKIDQPGVHCFILSDSDGCIYFQENHYGFTTERKITIYFAIEDIGFTPEHQFLKMKTRSISYYRNKKLKRIEDIYGKHI